MHLKFTQLSNNLCMMHDIKMHCWLNFQIIWSSFFFYLFIFLLPFMLKTNGTGEEGKEKAFSLED